MIFFVNCLITCILIKIRMIVISKDFMIVGKSHLYTLYYTLINFKLLKKHLVLCSLLADIQCVFGGEGA